MLKSSSHRLKCKRSVLFSVSSADNLRMNSLREQWNIAILSKVGKVWWSEPLILPREERESTSLILGGPAIRGSLSLEKKASFFWRSQNPGFYPLPSDPNVFLSGPDNLCGSAAFLWRPADGMSVSVATTIIKGPAAYQPVPNGSTAGHGSTKTNNYSPQLLIFANVIQILILNFRAIRSVGL